MRWAVRMLTLRIQKPSPRKASEPSLAVDTGHCYGRGDDGDDADAPDGDGDDGDGNYDDDDVAVLDDATDDDDDDDDDDDHDGMQILEPRICPWP